MNQILVSVCDLKADMFRYGNFSVYASSDLAIRIFKTQLIENSVMRNNKADFRLYKMADVDGTTGKISPLSAPELLYDGGVEVK